MTPPCARPAGKGWSRSPAPTGTSVRSRASTSPSRRRPARSTAVRWSGRGSLHWEGLIEVGDAYLRIGQDSGLPDATLATARRVYFAALFRACQKDSLDGILRVADAFARLGDGQVVEECVTLARLLAPED